MAKGDKKRVQNKIDYTGNFTQNHLDNLRNTVVPQNQMMQNAYTRASAADEADRASIMSQYKNFSDTGGYSPQDLANIRARSVSPLRSVYANANREVDRSKTLQGGYAPNYIAAKAKMSRELGQGMSDASTNAEGMIAQMVQQGKLAGMGGQLSTYGTAPGATNVTGNQMLASTGQHIDVERLQKELGLGLIGAQIESTKVPSNVGVAGGRIGSTVDTLYKLYQMGSGMGGAGK